MSSEDGTSRQKIKADTQQGGDALREDEKAVQKKSDKVDRKGKLKKDASVIPALRRAYETTMDEKIPQSMLDLLNKLD